MTHRQQAFALVAVYDDAGAAREDVEAVEDLATRHDVHLHDLAIVRHDDGQVEILHREQRSTQHGAEAGAIAGALAGILFPPALVAVPLGAVLGSGYGAFVAKLWRGLTRQEIEALGAAVEEGDCAVVAVGTSDAMDALERALARAKRIVRRGMTLEVEHLLETPGS
jgi:uncharacterized membrane protein